MFGLRGFDSSFLIVCFFRYTKDYPRSQHLMVSLTVCSMHCSCAIKVHLIPASGDDEVDHMPGSRAGMRPGGLVCILLFKHGVDHHQMELSADPP